MNKINVMGASLCLWGRETLNIYTWLLSHTGLRINNYRVFTNLLYTCTANDYLDILSKYLVLQMEDLYLVSSDKTLHHFTVVCFFLISRITHILMGELEGMSQLPRATNGVDVEMY